MVTMQGGVFGAVAHIRGAARVARRVTGPAARRADLPVTVAGLIDAYRAGDLTPADVMDATLARVAAHGDPAVWIGGIDADALREAAEQSEHRSARRCALRREGQHRCRRRADDCRLPGILVRGGDVGNGSRSSRRRRCSGDRKDEPRSVRHRSRRDPIAVRHADQPVRSHGRAGRVEFRLGGRGRGRARSVRPRHGHGGLRSRPGSTREHHRLQAHARSRQLGRRGPRLSLLGLCLGVRADRTRRGHRPRCARPPRCERHLLAARWARDINDGPPRRRT